MSEELLKWLRFAIDIEVKGLEFYKDCLSSTRNARAMELFDFLVKAETGHKKALEGVLEGVSRGDKVKKDKSVQAFLKIELKAPMFRKEEVKKITAPDARLTGMFNKAMEFEKQGIDLYTDLAGKEKDPLLKQLFRKLASDEEVHMKEIKDIGFFVFGVPPPDDYM
ncbi:ferritin family protein [Candidatus Woesearchaeota archaeon]|nr:ferritin family protein [Candidatus Woesearchaeota archaeon]